MLSQYRCSRPGSDGLELSTHVQGDGSVERCRERFTARIKALGVFGGGCGVRGHLGGFWGAQHTLS